MRRDGGGKADKPELLSGIERAISAVPGRPFLSALGGVLRRVWLLWHFHLAVAGGGACVEYPRSLGPEARE
jgi:hypothetical protein